MWDTTARMGGLVSKLEGRGRPSGRELQKDKMVRKRTEVTLLVSRGRLICVVERGIRGGMTLIGTCRLGIRDDLSQGAFFLAGL